MTRFTVCSDDTCTELAEVRKGRCPKHERPAWKNPSQHTLQRPADWSAQRLACLKRDKFECRGLLTNGQRCARRARYVDHVQPVAEGGVWELSNLQSLCDVHEAEKTANDFARQRMRRHART